MLVGSMVALAARLSFKMFIQVIVPEIQIIYISRYLLKTPPWVLGQDPECDAAPHTTAHHHQAAGVNIGELLHLSKMANRDLDSDNMLDKSLFMVMSSLQSDFYVLWTADLWKCSLTMCHKKLWCNVVELRLFAVWCGGGLVLVLRNNSLLL